MPNKRSSFSRCSVLSFFPISSPRSSPHSRRCLLGSNSKPVAEKCCFFRGKSRVIDGLPCCDMAIWLGMVHRHQGPVIKGVAGVSRTVHSLHTPDHPLLSESLHIFPSCPLPSELRRSDVWAADKRLLI